MGRTLNDYEELFASFLAAHAKAQIGDKEAVFNAQHLSNKILEAMQTYNPFGSDLFGGRVEVDDSDRALFEQCWKAYRRKGAKGKAYDVWKRIDKQEKELVLPHVRMYAGSRDICYQKDFERYLRDKTYKEIIVKGSDVIYDPFKPETPAEPVTKNKTLEYNGVIYR